MHKQLGHRWTLPQWLLGSRRKIAPSASDSVESSTHGAGAEIFAHADNASTRVADLVRPILIDETCLIVTGYQDFLSALSIILEMRPNLANDTPGIIRIVFGTNTETTDMFSGAGRPLSETAKRYYLGRSGLALDHEGDLKAVLARDAIAQGVIDIRVFDAELAREVLGRRPGLLHAKVFVGSSSAVMGSANFTRAGLQHNIELSDRFAAGTEAYNVRRDEAELFWRCGVDWNATALEIIDRLLRLTSAEDATCRMIDQMTGFAPWRVDQNTDSVGRLPKPFQADLIYEANATIYEHGFAFIEAPTGAGKTDIGKHLGATIPYMHDRVVLEAPSDGFGHRRSGSFAVVPARVFTNWDQNRASGFRVVRLSTLSQDLERRPDIAEDLNREFQNSTAVIVDECHLVNSRWLGDSTRARTFDESPAIWSGCLSATLLGNQGLDGLLAFHEKRASIYMSPAFTREMNTIFERERTREHGEAEFDLFGEPVQRGKSRQGTPGSFVTSLEAQQELSQALAPFVCRRERTCIGESTDRSSFTYPLVKPVRIDADVTGRRAEIIAEISDLASQITRGQILASPEHSRMGSVRVSIHDSERITVRNFLSLLRTSARFARWSWHFGKLGRRMQAAESGLPVGRGRIADQPDFGLFKSSRTPKCDRIQELLESPELLELDGERAEAMHAIVERHGQAIFLSERLQVLQIYAEMLQRRLGENGEVFAVLGRADNELHQALFGNETLQQTVLQRGEQAQDLMAIDGSRPTDGSRSIFMTYQRAEGINLQRASALGLIGITSNTKNMIQGMGRIDRIDSPYPEITYYTFDLPGLTLPSDAKARGRVLNNLILSGAPVTADAIEAELPAAGDLTQRIIDLKHRERVLRREHFHDTLGLLRRMLSDEVFERVRSSRPQGVWGAELCLLTGERPFTAFVLSGRAPGLGQSADFLPPRLITVAEAEVISGQVNCANLLLDAYDATRAAGLHDIPGTAEAQAAMLGDVQDQLSVLRHWDIRPERTVSLLSSLAAFLEGTEIDDFGEGLFGNLTLPALEHLADRWAAELDPAWITAKRQIRETMQAGGVTPDYLGIVEVVHQFQMAPPETIQAARRRMEAALAAARDASEGIPLGIQDRVAVIFRCQPNGDR